MIKSRREWEKKTEEEERPHSNQAFMTIYLEAFSDTRHFLKKEV